MPTKFTNCICHFILIVICYLLFAICCLFYLHSQLKQLRQQANQELENDKLAALAQSKVDTPHQLYFTEPQSPLSPQTPPLSPQTPPLSPVPNIVSSPVVSSSSSPSSSSSFSTSSLVLSNNSSLSQTNIPVSTTSVRSFLKPPQLISLLKPQNSPVDDQDRPFSSYPQQLAQQLYSADIPSFKVMSRTPPYYHSKMVKNMFVNAFDIPRNFLLTVGEELRNRVSMSASFQASLHHIQQVNKYLSFFLCFFEIYFINIKKKKKKNLLPITEI